MQLDCDGVEENIDAWALGALDVEESTALDAHVAGCAACRLLMDAASARAAAIAMAVPLVSASHQLKARVMAAASVMSDLPPRRAASGSRWWFAGAAAAVTFGLGALAWGGYLQTQVSDLHDREARIRTDATAQSSQFATMRTELVQASAKNVSLGSDQDAVLDIVSRPDLQRLPMSGTTAAPTASGRYIWSRSGGLGALVASNLPALADGRAYCLWVVYENAWIRGGTFGVDQTGSGRLIVHDLGNGQDHGAFRGFAVTIEPSTATTQHSGATVLQSGLQ
jgi:hypothetical protein